MSDLIEGCPLLGMALCISEIQERISAALRTEVRVYARFHNNALMLTATNLGTAVKWTYAWDAKLLGAHRGSKTDMVDMFVRDATRNLLIALKEHFASKPKRKD